MFKNDATYSMKDLNNLEMANNKNPEFFDNQTTAEPLLTTKELAKKLDCSVSYVKKLKALGKIRPCVSFNRFIRYKFTDVVASLQKWGLRT